ncbi:MAG TPA: ABC transporter permease, partial [Chryseolinea sp.]|nr:ABC transporter permease [Chryseolinea sp.]
MLKNYLKIIFRTLVSDGLYTAIVVLGLSVGISVCMTIAQYVHFESSFDTQYKDVDQIFYTYQTWRLDGHVEDHLSHPAVAPLIKEKISAVESAIRIAPSGLNRGADWVIKKLRDEKIVDYSRIDNMYFADEETLEFFSIKMLQGDAHTALRDKESIVLTQSVAKRFFADEDPLNQTLQILAISFKVTGVMEDPTPHSSLQYTAFLSLKLLDSFQGEGYLAANWTWPIFQTFIKIKPGADRDSVEKQINQAASVDLANLKSTYNIDESVRLYPFKDFHFFKPYNSTGSSPVAFSGDSRMIYFFTALGLLIIIISWANHINLTVARAVHRAKEVGLRKVNGATRNNLVSQFLLEFLLLNIIAFILALTFTQLTFQIFADAIASRATWELWRTPWFWASAILLIIASTLVSGIYPAFVISNYNPIKVLKGNFARSQSGTVLRQVLVLIQFGLSSILVMSIYVISKQLSFLQNRDLGMSVDKVMVIRLADLDQTLDKNLAFDRWMARNAVSTGVVNASCVSNYPGDAEPREQLYYLKANPAKKIFLVTNSITQDYFETMKISLLAGRSFNDQQAADSSHVIINETAAHAMGFDDPIEAVGHEIVFSLDVVREYKITGIVKDFDGSLKQPIL